MGCLWIQMNLEKWSIPKVLRCHPLSASTRRNTIAVVILRIYNTGIYTVINPADIMPEGTECYIRHIDGNLNFYISFDTYIVINKILI